MVKAVEEPSASVAKIIGVLDELGPLLHHLQKLARDQLDLVGLEGAKRQARNDMSDPAEVRDARAS